MTIYTFKSRQPFYVKEREGIKNNTAREIDLNEDKFLELIQHTMNGFDDGYIQIEIQEEPGYGLTHNNHFIRDIRDISIYNNLMIITWNHKLKQKGSQ